MATGNPAEHPALGGNGGRSKLDDYEAEADRHLMLNLRAMDPDKRKQWEEHCNNVVLRSLLPPPPTEQELADAKRVLGALERLRNVSRETKSEHR